MAEDNQDQASALEQALQGDASASGEIAGLVALAKMIEALPQPQIDMSFANALEQRLVGAATAAAAATPGNVPAGVVIKMEGHRRRMRRSLVAAIAAAFMFAMPIAASAEVTPDSSLYPVRLAREEARLWGSCRIDTVTCGFAHLDRANARLRDLRFVVATNKPRYIRPTATRLHRDLNTGARTVIGSRPAHKTLRRLAARIDSTSIELAKIASAAPATSKDAITSVIASGETFAQQVRIALGEEPAGGVLPPSPPIALPPPTGPPPAPANGAPKSNNDAKGSTKSPKAKRKKQDTFGPGGTVGVNKPPPGESWSSDDTVEDSCPISPVAAPGVDQACAAIKEKP